MATFGPKSSQYQPSWLSRPPSSLNRISLSLAGTDIESGHKTRGLSPHEAGHWGYSDSILPRDNCLGCITLKPATRCNSTKKHKWRQRLRCIVLNTKYCCSARLLTQRAVLMSRNSQHAIFTWSRSEIWPGAAAGSAQGNYGPVTCAAVRWPQDSDAGS
jgi:hypothetical protein